MNRQKISAILLLSLLTVSLTGCAAESKPVENIDTPQTYSADVTSGNDKSDDISAGITSETTSSTEQKKIPKSETDRLSEGKNEPKKSIAQDTQQCTQKPSTKPNGQTSDTESTTSDKTQKQPIATSPVKEPALETGEPPESINPPDTTPIELPKEEPPAEPAKPKFNINNWISFAKDYACKAGLALNSEAVDCWDDPIAANENCIYIERDIKDALDFYARQEDITDVWIWAEGIAPNSYELYIGYA